MDQANIINTITGILGVSVVTWFVYQLAPMIQHFVDDQLGYSRVESEFKDNQPLYTIFYKFNHKTSQEWLKWILTQSEEEKSKAYEKLQTYLESPAKNLGLSARDVIVAVAKFKHKDSFETLVKFLDNIKAHIGTLKTIELFYSDLLAAMIKLDLNKGINVLRSEIEYFSQKRNTESVNYDDFRIKLIRTFALLDTVTKECRDSMVEILCNSSNSATVRKELVKVIAAYKVTNVIEYVYPKVLGFFTQDDGIDINADSRAVLEFLFYTFKNLSKNNPEIWGLIINACMKDKTQAVYVNIVTNTIADRSEFFEYQSLIDLLKIEDPIKDAFRLALKERNSLTDEEMTLFRPKINEEDVKFDTNNTITIEKLRKTKVIVNKLVDPYRRLATILEQDFTTSNKTERRANHNIKLLTGTSTKEKLYLLRGLAANENRSFIYIDIATMIYNVPELNKLLSTINNSKPAIVYVDNLLHIFNAKLDDAGRGGLKIFFKTLRELAMLPSVTFFGGIEISGTELQKQSELKQIINSGIKGSYELSVNLDMPSEEEKRKIISDILEKITVDKIDKFFTIDSLITPTQDQSFLDFWIYVCDFFEKALMIRGRILDPDRLLGNQSHEDFQDQYEAGLEAQNQVEEPISAS